MVHAEHLMPLQLHWSHFLVAEVYGQPAGFGQVKRHLDGSQELASLVVLPAYRQRGVSTPLVQALLQRNPTRPIYLMCLQRLEPYYLRFGFRRARLHELPPYFMLMSLLITVLGWARALRGPPLPAIIMRRPPERA